MLGPLPPYFRQADFLAAADHDHLLAWVLANCERFNPALVNRGQDGSDNRVDESRRIASITRNLGGIEPLLRDRLLAALPRVAAGTGTRLEAATLELEIAAHGDGAFFTAHTDIAVGPNRRPLSGNPDHDRVLSAVYYFHRRPKGFSGGALRLYRYGIDAADGQDPANHVDLEPADNSLVAFPASVAHEVRPIGCPSGRFEDQRFAVNCWYCRPL